MHLVPVGVLDIVEKLSKAKHENEKMNYILRLEATQEYCSDILHQNTKLELNKQPFDVTKKKRFK